MSAVTDDIREQLERRRASRPRLSEGPIRVHGPPRLSTFWWWLRLSRLGIRVMLQQSQEMDPPRQMNTPQSWANANVGWTVFLRNCAVAIATERARREDPRELAKLRKIPEWDEASRAVFLSRWYPVPRPNEAGPATWSRDELPELARWVVGQVNANSDAWPHYPDGWRESLEEVKGALRR